MITKKSIPLPPLELAVMKALWQKPKISAQEIIGLCESFGIEIHPNLIYKLLRNLQDRGMIHIRAVESALTTNVKRYAPLLSCEEYLAATLQSNPAYEDARLPDILSCLLNKKQEPDNLDRLYHIIKTEKEKLK